MNGTTTSRPSAGRTQSRQRVEPGRIPRRRPTTMLVTTVRRPRPEQQRAGRAQRVESAATRRSPRSTRNRDGSVEPLRSGRQAETDRRRSTISSPAWTTTATGSIARNEWHWSQGSFAAARPQSQRRDFAPRVRDDRQSAGNRRRIGRRLAVDRVDAQARWTDAVSDVRAGDVLTFDSSGTIKMSADAGDARPRPAHGRDARPRMRRSQQLRRWIDRADRRLGAVWSVIGRTMTAPVSGRLYLGVNDDHLPDNNGEYIVTVGVQGRTLR